LTGAERIAAERQRQIDVGWTAEHDDTHDFNTFSQAAQAYISVAMAMASVAPEDRALLDATDRDFRESTMAPFWPWGLEWWKPSTDPARNVEKAGALLTAALDRLERSRVS
jgi:hypothetical protein